MAMPISRRQFFDRGTSVAALVGLISACGDGTTVPTSDELSSTTTLPSFISTSTSTSMPSVTLTPSDVAFAQPWISFIDQQMIELGEAVIGAAPETVAHARKTLQLATGMPIGERDQLFALSCEQDITQGDVVTVAGWVLPMSLAGLAGGLSRL